MKLSELKQIIRECIEEITINEKAPRRPVVVEPGAWEKHHGSRYTKRANTLGTNDGKEVPVHKAVTKSGKRKGKLTPKSQNALKDELTFRKNQRHISNRDPSYKDEPYMTPSGKEETYRAKSSYKKSGIGSKGR